MTREEAERECERLATQDPDRETHRFLPRQRNDGDWAVAKVNVAPAKSLAELMPETRADEKPPTPEDPRSPLDPTTGAAGF